LKVHEDAAIDETGRARDGMRDSDRQVAPLSAMSANSDMKSATLGVLMHETGWRAMLDTRANYSFEIQIKKPHRRKHDEMFS